MLRPLIPVLAAAWVLSACESSDPGLEEQVLLMQAEISKRDKRIQQLQEQLEDARENVREAKEAQDEQAEENRLISKTEAAGKLDDQVANWRRNLGGKFTDVEFTNYMLEPVAGPEQAMPFAGVIGLGFRMPDGRQGRFNLPVQGNAKGEWTLPTDEEVRAAVDMLQQNEQARQAKQDMNQSQGMAGRQQPQRQSQQPRQPQIPDDVMGAQRTTVIDWGDSPRQPRTQPRQQRAPAPQPQPNPPSQPPQQQQQSQQASPQSPPPPQQEEQGNSKPVEVMPVDRDVIIDFGD